MAEGVRLSALWYAVVGFRADASDVIREGSLAGPLARAFDLPVRVVVDTNQPVTGAIPVLVDGVLPDDLPLTDPKSTGEALVGPGRLINSGPFDGLSKNTAIAKAE